jgi:CheY-like chemotaxis protein
MALRKNLRILVVDDTSVSRQVLSQMLEHIGVHAVRSANSAQDALNDLNRVPADLVIADLHMPGFGGLELLKHIRQDRRTAEVRFVMTSGDDGMDWVDEARELGMDRFLPKPFDANRLVSCVESIAGRI